jgi:hypothetical protein
VRNAYAILITAFCESPDFDETRKRFDRLNSTISTLSDDELGHIQKAFASNNQLHRAYYLEKRLINFLKRCTGKDFDIDANEFVLKNAKSNK